MSTRLPFLYIKTTNGKGRGVFTAQEIPEGSHIESCPVLVLSEEGTTLIHQTKLHDYYFLWGDEGESAIALGFGSLYNHSSEANADYEMDIEMESLEIIAIKDIQPGEEITINYTDGEFHQTELWFEEK
ncbi:MAG: SET domain-containing protein [Lewinella sp.]|jgi:SET domain-containing protein|uniref:SET domain-containing protein n=1 Tax=Lewinella sp. TaxID=2004506 RepID=UPI003D6C2BE9